MKYCTKCGQQLLDDDMFCAKCGAKQNTVQPQQAYRANSEVNQVKVQTVQPQQAYGQPQQQAMPNSKFGREVIAYRYPGGVAVRVIAGIMLICIGTLFTASCDIIGVMSGSAGELISFILFGLIVFAALLAMGIIVLIYAKRISNISLHLYEKGLVYSGMFGNKHELPFSDIKGFRYKEGLIQVIYSDKGVEDVFEIYTNGNNREEIMRFLKSSTQHLKQQ